MSGDVETGVRIAETSHWTNSTRQVLFGLDSRQAAVDHHDAGDLAAVLRRIGL